MKKHAKDAFRLTQAPLPGWPEPMEKAAMCGLLGEIVRTIAPHTEADPAGLLLQTLDAFGNAVGRRPHFKVEADYHAANLFVALVGRSARGRKGTSWGYVVKIFCQVDKSWVRERVQPGLSTGEGLIQAIADNNLELQTQDRRLLVFEDEFSSVLRVMARWGNTLSTTLRHAWDGRTLQVMTKESPLRASNAHISIVAQTTQHDLNRYLSQTDLLNGFANRFLWACVQRSQLLPRGGGIPEKEVSSLARQIKKSLQFAKNRNDIGLSKNASYIWERTYSQLTADVPGLVGAATSRAEAQVRRLALIYALMNESTKVRSEHLRAALAVWRFCNDSAHFIFGDRSVTTLDDKLLAILRYSGNGLTRSEISDALGHHTPSQSISRALQALEIRGLVRSKRLKTKGRSAANWVANSDAGRE
jgi:Protein of unknown function (DUF3987)